MSVDIKIGTRYQVSPKWKKSFEELEVFRNAETNKFIGVRTLWRGGCIFVTPQNDDEVQELKDVLEQKDGEAFEPCFEEWEMGDCFDGVSEDIEFYGEHDNEEVINEEYEEGDDFTSSILEKFGFEPDDIEIFLWNEIEIEEAEDQY